MIYPFGKETPASIYNWSCTTFGPRSNLLIAGRAFVELAEFAVALTNNHDREKLEEEAADVAIMLWQLAATHNIFARPPSSGEFSVPAYSTATIGLLVASHFASYLAKLSHRPKELNTGLGKALEALEYFAEREKLDLPALVDAKMQVNRARTWAETGAGHFQHSDKVA